MVSHIARAHVMRKGKPKWMLKDGIVPAGFEPALVGPKPAVIDQLHYGTNGEAGIYTLHDVMGFEPMVYSYRFHTQEISPFFPPNHCLPFPAS